MSTKNEKPRVVPAIYSRMVAADGHVRLYRGRALDDQQVAPRPSRPSA